ncbi:hypothetical protein NPIL_589331 [Nephila pilipes]|uniref:Uncharacterized protein n=1 Tax=Nephila pilipes TaxID=299642 RepID=A0A8X6TZ00_NEPPI|nr:hypothetical protein NPIL_589331 [Nephila pilipes]
MSLFDLTSDESSGPNGIHENCLGNIGSFGKERILDNFDLSWKADLLPKQWKIKSQSADQIKTPALWEVIGLLLSRTFLAN